MPRSDKVSIVLPTYNGAKYLKESLDSCLSQTYSTIEVIVVVDGSSDDTQTILSQYKDERLKIIALEVNQGLSVALNTGFAISNGDYLTWTSDDNRYAPRAIETMLNFLQSHAAVDLVYAPYWEIDSLGKTTGAYRVIPPDRIMDSNPVGACFMYRRSVYEAIGDYDPNTSLFEDYEYWLRVSQIFKLATLDEPLYFYRLHEKSLTAQPGIYYKRWRLATHLKREKFGWLWRRYWLELAYIDIDESFLCYRQRDYARIPRLVIRALFRNPAWILNRGVVSIFIRSLGWKKR
jgi:glycosyltransferase involved in cell wall biosynthesis